MRRREHCGYAVGGLWALGPSAFEWEFGGKGIEVKVFRVSRDHGVDTVMYDPDPLRGGKYVLQAKRYTRTVDVAAVPDLYGTVINEGANRGILVTTSGFGPDSREFAKNKPITLVDGPNLIEMLRRHGRNYRIDLDEARRLQKARMSAMKMSAGPAIHRKSCGDEHFGFPVYECLRGSEQALQGAAVRHLGWRIAAHSASCTLVQQSRGSRAQYIHVIRSAGGFWSRPRFPLWFFCFSSPSLPPFCISRSRASIGMSRVDMDQERFAFVSKGGASALRTHQGNNPMIIKRFVLCCGIIALAGPAYAQVELKTYADRDGYIDVQALTCAQLANTYQEDADYLTTWYSGWYNGLAKKHAMKVDRAKTLEHELIVYCKANQGKKVIQAIDVVFKAYRTEKGIKMKE